MKNLFLICTLVFVGLSQFGCGRDVKFTSPSMEPTYKQNDVATVDYSAYESQRPKRWDIVTFGSPTGQGLWVMRVVGLPGESIDLKDGKVLINGFPQPMLSNPSIIYKSTEDGKVSLPYKIADEHYFLLGDNTSEAFDSRYWGAIPRDSIKGKVIGISNNPLSH